LPLLSLAAPSAVLALADGSLFHGYAIGRAGISSGEVVFNTAMTGYQEILSDPSYCRQIVTLTYPHIGNTGCNDEDLESDANHLAGLVVRQLPTQASNWRMQQSLSSYLQQHNIVAIAGVDTRSLTKRLRQYGAQAGCIVAAAAGESISGVEEENALQRARDFPGLVGMDLAGIVSVNSGYGWNDGIWQASGGFASPGEERFHVVAYDFGIKKNILRLLAERGCRLSVVPARTSAEEVMDMRPDGVFLSNGPGDPEPCSYAIASITELLARKVPLFGICLGHQLLALAAGAKSVKMKFGHHGANHPVQDLRNGKVMISSQNHGFAIDADSLPPQVQQTHISLFDGSLQGIELMDAPAFSFQGHPEASPGPHDVTALFDCFIELMMAQKEAN